MNCFQGSRLTLESMAVAFFLTAIVAGPACVRGRAQTATPILRDPIKTDAGFVSGTMIGEPRKEVRIYRGIPYAAPPVGDLRWKPPQPLTLWKGIRESTQYSKVCAQYYPNAHLYTQESQMSEDCLYLNVLTPARTADDKLPVMVWFHPGGLDTMHGNMEEYNSPALPQHGVVLVTVNHRLGAFGLLAHPDLAAESPHRASGNYGMLDMIAALQWVKQNIAAFGGNPDRVTIFGQSGGAQKVIWLLASPLAKGLFQRAIVESGTNLNLDDNNVRFISEEVAEKRGEMLAAKLGAKNISELRTKTWHEIIKAMPPPPGGAETVPAADERMHQVIDTWSLPDHPINIFRLDRGNDVPVLIGGDQNETRVYGGYVTDWLPALTKQKNIVYVYQFTHVPTNWKKAGMIAPHGFEVRYHFGYLGWTWDVPEGLPADPGLGKDDEIVAENTMRMWSNFAATGDPSVEGVIKWPAFKPTPGKDKYVTIDLKPEVQSGFMETFKPK